MWGKIMVVDISGITLDNIHLYYLIGIKRKYLKLTDEEKNFLNDFEQNRKKRLKSPPYKLRRTYIRPYIIKSCIRCGKEFEAKRNYAKYCNWCRKIHLKEYNAKWVKEHRRKKKE